MSNHPRFTEFLRFYEVLLVYDQMSQIMVLRGDLTYIYIFCYAIFTSNLHQNLSLASAITIYSLKYRYRWYPEENTVVLNV